MATSLFDLPDTGAPQEAPPQSKSLYELQDPAVSSAEPPQSAWYDISRFDLGRLIELAVLAIISLLIALFVGRPLVKTMALPPARPGALALPGSGGFDQIEGDPVQQIAGLIASNPQASTITVRQWLQDNR